MTQRTRELEEFLNVGTWIEVPVEEYESYCEKMDGVYTDEDALKPGFIFGEVVAITPEHPTGYVFWKRVS